MAAYRAERLAHEIQRYVSEMVQFELRDPRLHLASVTRVEVSHDLRHAKVFVSAVNPDDREQAAAALHHARALLRRGLAARLSLRTTPELHFQADMAIIEGDRVLGMLRDMEQQVDQHG